MARSEEKLSLTGLGISGNRPPDAIQPTLVDGVHLRWAFRTGLGFPWHGFYLYRRRHRAGTGKALGGAGHVSGEGPPLGTRVSTSLGELSSDTDLIVTDNFPPAGTGEYDLAGRRYLRLALPEGKRARRVAALVGFRRGESTTTGVGGRIVFTGRIVGPGPNPLMEQGVRFEVRDKLGSPQPSTVIRSRESEVGRITDLDWDYEFRIDLPDPFRMIRLASTYHSGESEVGR